MKRTSLLLILLVIISAPLFLSPIVSADDPTYTWEESIGPMAYIEWNPGIDTPVGTTFYGTFTITDEDIQIYIVGENGWAEILETGGTTDILHDYGDRFEEFTFEFMQNTPEQRIHFIFANYDNLFFTSTVEANMAFDNTPPTLEAISSRGLLVSLGDSTVVTVSMIDNFGLYHYSFRMNETIIADYNLNNQPTSHVVTELIRFDEIGNYTLIISVTDIRGLQTTQYMRIQCIISTTLTTTGTTGTTGTNNPSEFNQWIILLPVLAIAISVVIIGYLLLKQKANEKNEQAREALFTLDEEQKLVGVPSRKSSPSLKELRNRRNRK